MNGNVVISFLVTFYNQDRFIQPTIEKLVNLLKTSSHYSWEILIGIDYASDIAKSVCERWLKNERIKVYFLHSSVDFIPFARASQNRLFLLKKAVGKYFMMLDGDDYFDDIPNKAIELLEKDELLIGVAHNYSVLKVSKEGSTFEKNKAAYKNFELIDFEKYVKCGRYFHVNTLVMRTCRLKEFQHELYFNDGVVQPYILQSGLVEFLDIPIMVYRVGLESIYASQSYTIKKLTNCITYEYILKNIANNKKEKDFCLHRLRVFFECIDLQKCELSRDCLPDVFLKHIISGKLTYSKFFSTICSVSSYFLSEALLKLILFDIRMKLFLNRCFF